MKFTGKVFLVFSLIIVGVLTVSVLSISIKWFTPSQLVEHYFISSMNKDFKELYDITIVNPELLEKEKVSLALPKSINTDHREIKMRDPKDSDKIPNYPSEVYSRFVREDFPKMIFKANLRIKSIESEVIDDKKAKVSILVTNDINIKAMPWTFLLLEQDGEWKIFDVTTSD